MIVPVLLSGSAATILSGNPLVESLDGTRRATLRTILHESWPDADRAEFGVYLVEINPPPGERWAGGLDGLAPIYEPIPPPTPEQIAQQRQAERTDPAALTAALEVVGKLLVAPALESLDEADLVRVAPLFPDWSGDGIEYAAGDVLNYDGEVVEVIQAHTSQPDWTPDATPALFKRYREPGGVSEWVQPTGAHDAYNAGDRVTHNGKTWESAIDGNVWEPGVHGWIES